VKVIYDDYGGTHSTPVAAALHLGTMDPDRLPGDEELLALPLFDRVTKDHHGCAVYMGTDREGHRVYVLGRGPSAVAVERAVASGVAMVEGGDAAVLFVETLPYVNVWMRIGGFLSRALGLVSIGRPIVLYGTRKAFPHLVRLVQETKGRLAQSDGWSGIRASSGADLSSVAAKSVHRGILGGITSGPSQPAAHDAEKE
jgi:hypothetical protein